MAGQSMSRKIKRGHVRMVWNETFKKMEFFRRSGDGLFILCHPISGNYIRKGPGKHRKTLDKWEKL